VVSTSGIGWRKTDAVAAPMVSKYRRKGVMTEGLFLLYIALTKALVNDLEKRIGGPLA
jgi:ATP-dependent helicase Lhr and Lhr-like helicase